ncbi:hypothetical protein ONZ45_g3706 [Pleurotus djamor]|nr:hypothetical protein ONZ45_g3706 [Pleurotus djamor]
MYFAIFVVTCILAVQTVSEPIIQDPVVTLDDATVVGAGARRVNRFLGIPYAKPPTGDRRFRLPELVDPYTGTIVAKNYGPACPQQGLKVPLPPRLPLVDNVVDILVNKAFNALTPSDEDCGWEIGATSPYDGTPIVERSIQIGQPVIYVSMNYRLHALGFLPGKEVKDAGVGNLGLHDQRQALRWIQKYISGFGGDPTKVTIWGESAGSISVSLHMLMNGGDPEGLFRGAVMQSGSPFGVGDLTNGQWLYDHMVSETGCSGASDTLACLRAVPYSEIQKAVDSTPSLADYQGLSLVWIPRVDGVLFTDSPQKLIQQGKVAAIPFISGGCDDEGTIFSLASLNVTNTPTAKQWVEQYWYPGASSADLDQVVALYPNNLNIFSGAPLTGVIGLFSSQFSRISTFQGDAFFHAPRRSFLRHRSDKQDTWVYLSKRLKLTPLLGSFHISDLFNSYGGGELTDYLVYFAHNLDPNGGSSPVWPKYSVATPRMMTFQDNPFARTTITQDTFRAEAMDHLIAVGSDRPTLL